MIITINDSPKEFSAPLTVDKLLQQLQISGPVAVEINRSICPKRTYAQTVLKEGDVLEVVTIVGGG